MFPLLFLLILARRSYIVIEVFSRLFNKVATDPNFKHHWRCKALNLTHLCFVDDLMLFCHVDEKSIGLLKKALDTFSSWSSLEANIAKSNIFFSRVNGDKKLGLISIFEFHEGKLPMRYLGVPLITKKLSHSNCKSLVDKILA